MKQKILAEIERLKKYSNTMGSNAINSNMRNFYDGNVDALKQVEDFINSLPEEHVSEDFEQPKEQSKDIHTLFDLAAKALFDIASLLPTAEGKEKDVVENIRLICQDYGFKGMMIREEPVSEDLKVAAQEYEQNRKDYDATSDNEIVRRAFKAGAQWQKEKLTAWLKREADFLIQELKKGNKAYGMAEQYRAQLYKEIINKIKDE